MTLNQEDSSQHLLLFLDDTFERVFKKENLGRVHDLGLRACPLGVLWTSSQQFGGIHFRFTFSTYPASQGEMDTLKSKLSQIEGKI